MLTFGQNPFPDIIMPVDPDTLVASHGKTEPNQSFLNPKEEDPYEDLPFDKMSLPPSIAIHKYRREAIENYHYAKNDRDAVAYAYETLPKLIHTKPYEGKRFFYFETIDRLMGRRQTDLDKLDATLGRIRRIALGDMEEIEATYREQNASRSKKEKTPQAPQPSPDEESKTETQPNQPDYNPVDLIDYLRRRDFAPVERVLYDAARTLYAHRDYGVDYILGQRRLYEYQKGESWWYTATKWTVTAFSRWGAKEYFRKFESLSLPKVPQRQYGKMGDLALGSELSRNVQALEASHFEEIQEGYFVLSDKQDSNIGNAETIATGAEFVDAGAELTLAVLMSIRTGGNYTADVATAGSYRFLATLAQERVRSWVEEGEYNVDMAELEERTRLDRNDPNYMDPTSDAYAESIAELEKRRIDATMSPGRALWAGAKSATFSALFGKFAKYGKALFKWAGKGISKKLSERAAKETAKQAEKKLAEETAKETAEDTGQRLAQEATQETTKEAGEKLAQEATEKTVEGAGKAITIKVTQRAAHKIGGRVAKTLTEGEAESIARKVVGENANQAAKKAAENAAKSVIATAKKEAYQAAKDAAARGGTEEAVEKAAREAMENVVRKASREAAEKALMALTKASAEVAEDAVKKLTLTALNDLFKKEIAAKVIAPMIKEAADKTAADIASSYMKTSLKRVLSDTAKNLANASSRSVESMSKKLAQDLMKAAVEQAEKSVQSVPTYVFEECLVAARNAMGKAKTAAEAVARNTLDDALSQASKDTAQVLAKEAAEKVVVDAMRTAAQSVTKTWAQSLSKTLYSEITSQLEKVAWERLGRAITYSTVRDYADAYAEAYIGSKSMPWLADRGIDLYDYVKSIPEPTVVDRGISESGYPGLVLDKEETGPLKIIQNETNQPEEQEDNGGNDE